ncbi:MAG TPA: NAD-glutamate dehydrogenase [Caulobacteraceae bacterium]|jgi:glutamate dehydrogenase|nr:NAD-glutamate dehydrogenase [Caulobacteraceae bacterium]
MTDRRATRPSASPPAPQPLDQTLTGAFADALAVDALGPAETAFVIQMAEDYVAGEAPELDAARLGASLADLWRLAEQRGAGPAIRIVRLGLSDRLDIVQADSPFLVDSVMGEITERRIPIQAMFHAVIDVARDAGGARTPTGETARESMIQVFLDPLGEDQAEALAAGLEQTLADVRLAVGDYDAMRAMTDRAIAQLDARAADLPPGQLKEYQDFLRWMRDQHFIFLGARVYEYPRTPDGGYAAEEPLYQPEGSLGVLRDQARAVLRRSSEPAVLSAQLHRHLGSDTPLTVGKSNLRSRIHRRGYMDYVGVRRYGADGRPSGEIRFVGLFAAEAYDDPVHEIPLVRRKVEFVLANSGRVAGGHSDRRLHNILENFPRDELFQISERELLPIALGVLHLNDRPRVKLFARGDPFDRFISLLVYLPRESYDARLPSRIGAMLATAYGGHVSASYPSFSDAPLARIHYIIGVEPGAHLDPDLDDLEAEVAEAARSWESRLEAGLRAAPETAARAGALMARYAAGFPPGYRDLYDASETIPDIVEMEAIGPDRPVGIRAYRHPGDPASCFRFELYRWQEAAALADVLPILDNMGLKAMVEEGFPIPRAGPNAGDAPDVVWAHEFTMADAGAGTIAFDAIEDAFEEAFVAVWDGRTENDGFNRLVIELGVSWREAALVRALARYRQQSGLEPSEAVQQAALSDHPDVTRLILELFHTRFDPATGAGAAERQAASNDLCGAIGEALQGVESLDADRVLRRLAALVQAATRTNYFQLGADGRPKPYISFKVASRELEDLPEPKPFREIFVAAPHVEAVHLRFGPIARGGIRWSDRRDDFRTEVLGLVKAQNVKNAVIVPVGSKGGFYPKRLPRGGSADAVRAEAVRAYRTFLDGLLDLTDNLAADGSVAPPDGVVVLDDDDPYLVVAADKGTASFSDIANGIAEDYGFWLGDAFASGGSAGYDHKAMGITARGAWEAVKRHFREMGKDTQTEPFSVIGVGDMSGDVFGNGMLLSKEIRLIAAFDHRDIFIDPDPDPAASFAERQRLFNLPRSSWADYDAALISRGGGVFSRTLKSVSPTPEIKALLDLHVDALTPAELISAVLKAKAELLYLGGVGTYIKAPFESQLDVGDKANDAVRIDATALRCKVVGEGANLGVTQAGRIAFARAGGRIDTDAIDNSAGVDTSDHEVNIKILTGMAEAKGELDRPGRDRLLQSMTDEVAAHVLRHNIDQTLALSLMQRSAVADLDAHADFMAALEQEGRLDRALEALPDPAAIAALRQAGLGLTRPELSVLLAYGKNDLFDAAVGGGGPDDPFFFGTLKAYFPAPLARFSDEMWRHRLRREIIANVVCNDIVNRCGPTFPRRLMAAAGCDTTALIVGFAAAKETLRSEESWNAIAALEGEIPAEAQTGLFAELAGILRAQTYWLARRAGHKGLVPSTEGRPKAEIPGGGVPVASLVRAYQPTMDELRRAGPDILSPFEQKIAARRIRAFRRSGAPNEIAVDLASLGLLTTACDLADLAKAADWPVRAAAILYHQAGSAFGFDRLRDGAGSLRAADSFERVAVRRLIEDLVVEQTALTRALIDFAGGPQAAETAAAAKSVVRGWAALHADTARACQATLAHVEQAGDGWSFAKLTIAAAALRELVADAR